MKIGCPVSPICSTWGLESLAHQDSDDVRKKIADICNHAMRVHNAGPQDAWAIAKDHHPEACAVWEAEVFANPELELGL